MTSLRENSGSSYPATTTDTPSSKSFCGTNSAALPAVLSVTRLLSAKRFLHASALTGCDSVTVSVFFMSSATSLTPPNAECILRANGNIFVSSPGLMSVTCSCTVSSRAVYSVTSASNIPASCAPEACCVFPAWTPDVCKLICA